MEESIYGNSPGAMLSQLEESRGPSCAEGGGGVEVLEGERPITQQQAKVNIDSSGDHQQGHADAAGDHHHLLLLGDADDEHGGAGPMPGLSRQGVATRRP